MIVVTHRQLELRGNGVAWRRNRGGVWLSVAFRLAISGACMCSVMGGVAHGEPSKIGGRARPAGDAPMPDQDTDTSSQATPSTETGSAAEPDPPLAVGQSGEPSVEVVWRAAVALALAEPERARSFLDRARLAGWFPEIHFRVYRRFARTEGLSFADAGVAAVAPVDISSVDDVRYEWRASWDLSRMVFNPDELQAHFEALRMSDTRRDIQSLVIKLYFERRRLVAEVGASSEPAVASGKRSLRIAEIEALLDAMSGDAFSGGSRARESAEPAP